MVGDTINRNKYKLHRRDLDSKVIYHIKCSSKYGVYISYPRRQLYFSLSLNRTETSSNI